MIRPIDWSECVRIQEAARTIRSPEGSVKGTADFNFFWEFVGK